MIFPIKKPSVSSAQLSHDAPSKSHASPSNSPVIPGSGYVSTTVSHIRASRPRYPSKIDRIHARARPQAPRVGECSCITTVVNPTRSEAEQTAAFKGRTMKPLPTISGLLALTAIISYAAHEGFITGLAIFGLLICAAGAADKMKSRNLASAPHGSTRIETVKQQHVNQTVQQYAKAGWLIVSQSSSKSFGTQARVTLTFQKP